jgi:hypothetical protein
MDPEQVTAVFVARYLTPRGLPISIFDIHVNTTDGLIKLPNGVAIEQAGDDWRFVSWNGMLFDARRPVTDITLNRLFDRLAKDYAKKTARRKLRAEYGTLATKTALQEAEIATLRAEVLELSLRPGGPEYKVAEEHFAKLAN